MFEKHAIRYRGIMSRSVFIKTVLCFFLGMGSLFVSSGCDPMKESEAPPVQNTVVARVNGKEISRDTLQRNFNLAKKKFRVNSSEPLEKNKLLWLKINTLNEAIEEILFQQEAKKHNVSVSEDELNTFRVQFMDGYLPEAFEKTLEIVEVSQKEWEQKLESRLLIKKLITEVVNSTVNISEEDVKRYFEQHPEEFKRGEQIRALHILVKNEEEAQRIIKLIEEDKDFSELAREYSISPESLEGGDMGYIEAGTLPEEFDPIFKLKKDGVSRIINTPYGFHVFKVVDKVPASQKSFEESKENIRSKLIEESQEVAFRKWLDKIRKSAKIEIENDVLAEIK